MQREMLDVASGDGIRNFSRVPKKQEQPWQSTDESETPIKFESADAVVSANVRP